MGMKMIKMLDRVFEKDPIFMSVDCVAELYVSDYSDKEHGVFAILKENHPERNCFADAGIGVVSKHKTRAEAYEAMKELAAQINGD